MLGQYQRNTVAAEISKYMGNAVKLADIWGTLIYNVKAAPFLAKGDGVTDDSASVQAAITYAQTNGGGIVVFPPSSKQYIISSPLVIYHGTGYSNVTIEGNNVQIWYGGTGACFRVQPVELNDGSHYGLGHFEIKNFSINTAGTTGTVGADIGQSGYKMDDFAFCLVENLTLQNFDIGVRITEARHIVFRDVVVRTPKTKGLFIQSLGSFCGDITFDSCEFSSGAHSATHIFSFNGQNNTNSETRGIHFTDTDFYGSSTAPQTISFEASGYGRIFDIWFTSCALDSGFNHAFSLDMQGNSTVGYIHILDTYAVNFTTVLSFSNTSTNQTGMIWVRGCQFGLSPLPFNIFNIQNIKITDNDFVDVTAQSVFSGACKNIQLLGNSMRGSSNLSSASVQIQSTVLSAIIKNNFGNFLAGAGFVQNQTSLPATALVIADNLQTIL